MEANFGHALAQLWPSVNLSKVWPLIGPGQEKNKMFQLLIFQNAASIN